MQQSSLHNVRCWDELTSSVVADDVATDNLFDVLHVPDTQMEGKCMP